MDIKITEHTSETQKTIRKDFHELFRQCPIPEKEILSNLSLFLRRPVISRILYMHELYRQIVNVPGVVIEFGTRWGPNMALFESFRGIHEPFNQGRLILGFDTFEGFAQVSENDGKASIVEKGAFSVTAHYEEYLARVLDYHEHEAPMAHIKKYRLQKGDASVEFEKYLQEHPETIVALAYFDFDVYEPTRKCLDFIRKHVVKGSILAFDELHLDEFPGETIAVQEALGLRNCRLIKSPYAGAYQAYMVVE